jgi:integrase
MKKKEFSMTFENLADLWLTNKKEKIKPSTYQKYQNIIKKHLFPVIGKMRLDTISTCTMDTAMQHIYWTGNNEHLSCSLMNSILFVSKSILRYGGRIQLLKGVEITFEISSEPKKEIPVLSYTHIQILRNYIVVHPSDAGIAILMALYTGMRLGEICALQRKDLDFELKVIYVCKTVQRLKTEPGGKTRLVITVPKSHNSLRCIPMPISVEKYLCALNIDKLTGDQFILGQKYNPYDPRTLQYNFSRILKECHIEHINFHALRHTFATNCIKSGFDVKTLSEILGHSNVNFTMNRYVHSDIEEKRKQMEMLDDYLS